MVDERSNVAENLVPSTPEPHFGPYVPPDGGTLEAIVVVKAAPENTKSHDVTVCTAAVLDDGRLVRLYPVQWADYMGARIPKYARVRVDAVPSDEAANRPESHKVKGGLRVMNRSLCSGRGGAPWNDRMAILRQNVEPDGVASLRAKQEKWRTSLGIVKVRHLNDFHIDGEPDEIIRQADYRASAQQTLKGGAAGTEGSRIDQIEHVFRYNWGCTGSCCDDGPNHDMQCEDWELFESFRQWKSNPRYDTKEKLDRALWNKYYDEMSQKDLHFILGTTSRPAEQQSFTIIGIVYPPTRDPGKRPEAPKYREGESFRPKKGARKRRKSVPKGQKRIT